MMESRKILSICREPHLSNFSTIFHRGAVDINGVSRLKNDNFTVTPEMHVHFRGRKNYTRKPGIPSSNAEVSERKKRALSGRFNSRKDCFYCGCVIIERKKKPKKS